MKKLRNYFSHFLMTTVSFNKHYQNLPDFAKKTSNKFAYIFNGIFLILMRRAIDLIAVNTELGLLLALLFRNNLTQMWYFHIVTLRCFITRLVRYSNNRKGNQSCLFKEANFKILLPSFDI